MTYEQWGETEHAKEVARRVADLQRRPLTKAEAKERENLLLAMVKIMWEAGREVGRKERVA